LFQLRHTLLQIGDIVGGTGEVSKTDSQKKAQVEQNQQSAAMRLFHGQKIEQNPAILSTSNVVHRVLHNAQKFFDAAGVHV
jgi:hypothetical protein